MTTDVFVQPELRVYRELIRTDVRAGEVRQQILRGRYATKEHALEAAARFAERLREETPNVGGHVHYTATTVMVAFGAGEGFTEFCVSSLRDPIVEGQIAALLADWCGGALPKGVL